jgi:hypothetical protein
MMGRLLKALEGPNGAGYDTARILFALGGFCGIFAPLIFQGIALYKGQEWHPAEFCGGYFGGLGAYLGGGGLGISLKDKGVASAQNTTAPSPPDGGQP